MQYSFIYPAEAFNLKKVDDHFKEEFNLFKEKGFNVALIDFYDEKVKGQFSENEIFIYRGWMLSNSEYTLLESLLLSKGAKLLTNKEAYYNSHHLKNNYASIKEFTPETVFCSKEELSETLNQLNWDSYFVKDFVKSLTTERGSIANSNEEAIEISNEIEKFRGTIEGGISLREVKTFSDDFEIRYFVLNGKVYSPNGHFYDLTRQITELHKEPFYSVDITKDINDVEWIVEIGDGQVSDLKGKGWIPENFVNIFL